jgi:hypothetical protein
LDVSPNSSEVEQWVSEKLEVWKRRRHDENWKIPVVKVVGQEVQKNENSRFLPTTRALFKG